MKKIMTIATALMLVTTISMAGEQPQNAGVKQSTKIGAHTSPCVPVAVIDAVTKMLTTKLEANLQVVLNKMMFSQQAHALKVLGVEDDSFQLTKAPTK